MSPGIRRAVLAGLLVLLASCVTAGGTPRTGPVTLRVTNANAMNVNVYVLADGHSTRMGTVSTAQSASYPVPDRVWQAVGGMQVRIDPIGSATGFTSDRILGIERGRTINVEVAANLSQTWYQVR